MFFQRNGILISILLVLFIAFPLNAIPQGSGEQTFNGKVVQISQKFITIGKTTIVLPKNIKNVKTLDMDGSSISFETIRKNDAVSVTVNRDGAVIRRVLESKAVENKTVDRE